MSDPTKTRGFLNHNPMNLEECGIPWHGVVGRDGPYLIFDTDLHGLRAGFRDLYEAQKLHKFRTIPELVDHFAPETDGNDTAAYASSVCRYMGVNEETPVNLASLDMLKKAGCGFIRQEIGGIPYPDEILSQAALLALAN